MKAVLQAPGIGLPSRHLIGLRSVALHPSDPASLAALPGGFVTKKRGQGQEMADVREYVSGDDIRHLDRGSTARTGTLHVRSFQEERDRVTLLVADFRPAMLWGTQRAFRSVAAAEALALVGWRVIEEGGRVGLLALGPADPVVAPIRGRRRGMLDVIGGLVRAHEAALTLVQAGDVQDPLLDAGLARAARLAPPGAEVIVASGFDATGSTLDEQLGKLGQRRLPRLISVTDGAAAHLPPGVYPIRLPDGSRRRAQIAGNDRPAQTPDHAGLPTLVVDACAPLADTARLIDAFFSPGATP